MMSPAKRLLGLAMVLTLAACGSGTADFGTADLQSAGGAISSFSPPFIPPELDDGQEPNPMPEGLQRINFGPLVAGMTAPEACPYSFFPFYQATSNNPVYRMELVQNHCLIPAPAYIFADGVNDLVCEYPPADPRIPPPDEEGFEQDEMVGFVRCEIVPATPHTI